MPPDETIYYKLPFDRGKHNDFQNEIFLTATTEFIEVENHESIQNQFKRAEKITSADHFMIQTNTRSSMQSFRSSTLQAESDGFSNCAWRYLFQNMTVNAHVVDYELFWRRTCCW